MPLQRPACEFALYSNEITSYLAAITRGYPNNKDKKIYPTLLTYCCHYTILPLVILLNDNIMYLTSLRIITADIRRLVQFLEKITGLTAKWYTEDFAEIVTTTATLAIGSTRTMAFFGADIALPASNKSVIIEFRVENVDVEYERVKDFIGEVVQKPTTMPWGNRSLLFRDPDGNLINFFTPVTFEAIEKFS